MADLRLAPVLRYLHRLAAAPSAEEPSDADLLERLASRQDPSAFEALVRRYGPLVWRVCLRVVRREQDAEDAYQATFLILARRAGAIRKPGSLASFLHGAAYRIARRAMKSDERRRAVERKVPSAPIADPVREAAWHELGRMIEEEVHALPEGLRMALLLSYWEGLSNEETARRLGWPSGTVKTRLAKARKLLHQRLLRRGVSLPAGVTTLLIASSAGKAAVPPPVALGSNASPRVAALAEEGLRRGALAKIQLGLLVLTVGAATAGLGALSHRVPAEEKPTAAAPQESPQPAKEQPPVHVDLHGDPLPDSAVTRLGTVRFRAGNLVYCCAYSPDGKTLAAGSADGTAHLFDADTGKPLRQLRGHQFHVLSLAYAPDGRTLATGGADSTICLWESSTGKLLRQFRAPAGPIWSLTFARDGKGLFSAGGDTRIHLWDPENGKELRQFTEHKLTVCRVALSPDGRTIASAADKEICLWEMSTGKLIRRLTGQKEQIRTLAFSPDGKWLASGSRDGMVWLWETATGKVRRRLPEDPKEVRAIQLGYVYTVTFSPDGKTLAAGCADYTLRFWDVDTGKKRREVPGMGSVTFSGFHEGGIPCVVFSRDGKTLAFARDNQIALLDVSSGKELFQVQAHRGSVRRLFFSPDGKRLLTTNDDPGQRVLEWDATTGRLIRQVPGKVSWAHLVAFSPDRTIMAATQGDATLHLSDVQTGKEIRPIPLPIKNFQSPLEVAFSPDGKLLAAASGIGDAVWLIDAATGKEVCAVEEMGKAKGVASEDKLGNDGRVASLAFSPDGRLLAASAYSILHVAEVPSGRQLLRIALPKKRIAIAVAFSPDGRTLAAPCDGLPGDRKMRLWETATGKERLVLPAPPAQLRCVTFSPDGRLLAAGGYDRPVFVWDMVAGKGISRLEGHQGEIESVAFSPDGRRLASASLDTTALIWDVSRLAKEQRRREPLTPKQLEEWWSTLAGTDAIQAYQAILALESVPEQAVPLLAERLRLQPESDTERIVRLLAQLDGELFADRERASAELRRFGWAAEPALRKLLKGKPSLEARKRAQELLDDIRKKELPPDLLRMLRGMEVLEHIGTPQAKRILQTLAGGMEESRLTREAKASLERLARRRGT